MEKLPEKPPVERKTLHADHRSRVKAKFEKSGPEVFEDHELLELLLFFAVPRVNTNPTAHALIHHFGSLDGVLKAPLESLCQVEGVGKNSALLLRVCQELVLRCQRQEEEQKRKAVILSNGEDAVRFFRPKYKGMTIETVMAAFLDNSSRVILCRTYPPQQVNFTNLDIRTIVVDAVSSNAVSVVLAHNHPDGSPEPSGDDRNATNSLRSTLYSMKMGLFDHVIIGEGGSGFSMRECGMLCNLGHY